MESITDKKISFLNQMANFIRQDVLEMLYVAGSGHTAGALGMADIFTALYFHILEHRPSEPNWIARDKLVLSNGHICPVQYASLARAGYFPQAELQTLRKIGSRLQGHPHRKSLPGIETTSGPLGSGLSQAIGMALAAKMDKRKIRVYCILSDAEHQEGNLWEAIMFAGARRLSNLIAIIDRNNIQISGHTEDVMPLESLRQKYEAFGWHVLEIDGHSFESIIAAAAEARAIYEKPSIVIAHTISGRGVSFMESDPVWHGKVPNKEELKSALSELKKKYQINV